MCPPLRLLSLLFAVSGAAGLVQEVAWSRALAQSLGHSLQALTAVLIAFLGGLGLGSLLGARVAGRVGSPLRLYAALEALVAAGALLAPAAARLVAGALERFGPHLETPGGVAALRLLLALGAILPPTVAMGMTLPCLVREAIRRGADPAGAVSSLYGWNTLGGAAGAALGSFLLLPHLGTRMTFILAGGLNLAAGAAALALASAPGGRPDKASAAGDAGREEAGLAAGPAGAFRRHALAAALVTGCAGAILQVGWIRIATLAFGSTVYALGATLTAYIAGLGIGPLLAGRMLRERAAAGRVAARATGAAGLAALALLPVLGFLPGLGAALGGSFPSAAWLLLAAPFVLLFAGLLPATAAHGAAFPALALLCGQRDSVHHDTGVIYAASTAGSVLGFLLSGFLLLPAFGSRYSLALAGLAFLAVAAALGRVAARTAPGRPAAQLWVRLMVPVAAVLLIAASGRTWRPEILTGGGVLYGPVYRAAGGQGIADAMRRRGRVLYYREDGDGIVTVRRNPAGVLSLQINGKTEASTGGDLPTQLLAGHLPLLLHPAPERVLLIGLASGITLGAVATHPVVLVTVFEIAPGVVAAARLFDAHHGRALDDPRLELRLDDARGGLLVRPERYDVISSQPSNPWVAGVANLFTEEFYRLARARLAPGGLFCQWVQAYRLAPEDLKSIVAAFLRVYPEATLWEESAGGGDYFLVGGDGPLRIDPARMESALRPGARENLRHAGIEDTADLLARFVSGPGGLARLAGGATPHSDDLLSLETRAPLALFRDDPRTTIALLHRHREPVLDHLEGGGPPDPDLSRALRARLRASRERLVILAGLGDADLWALTDPFLAAGADALRRGLPIQALAPLQRALAENPESAAVSLLLAAAYRGAGLEDASRVALRTALEIDPTLAPAWNLLGRAALDLGAVAEAARAFEEAARHARDPALLAAARNNLGTLKLETGDLDGAERLFREAIAADPDLSAAHANLGLALKRRGDAASAAVAYREALAIDPLNNDARYNLARLLAAAGRKDEAASELRRLLEIDPDDAEAARDLRALVPGG